MVNAKKSNTATFNVLVFDKTVRTFFIRNIFILHIIAEITDTDLISCTYDREYANNNVQVKPVDM